MGSISPSLLAHPSALQLLEYWYPGKQDGEKALDNLGEIVDTSPNILSTDCGCAAPTSPKNEDVSASQTKVTSPTTEGTDASEGRKRERTVEEENSFHLDPPSSANKRRGRTASGRSHATPKWTGFPQNTLPVPSDHKLVKEQSSNSANWVKHTLDFCYEYRQFLQSKGGTHRVDLETLNYMRAHGLLVNQEKRSGEVPGVTVGFRFFSRVELAMVGMHFAFHSPIDTRIDGDFKAVATSVIMSGAKDDSIGSNGEVVDYTGQGGAHHKADKGVPDQKLCGGNMAMFLSFKRGYPIRLIRGKTDDRSPSKTTFTYYGLYRITGMEQRRGPTGDNAYSFQMTRLPNQAALNLSRRQQIRYPPC